MKKFILLIAVLVSTSVISSYGSGYLSQDIDAFPVAERCSSYVEIQDPVYLSKTHLGPTILTKENSMYQIKSLSSEGLITLAEFSLTSSYDLKYLYFNGGQNLRNISVGPVLAQLNSADITHSVDFTYLFIIAKSDGCYLINEKGTEIKKISTETTPVSVLYYYDDHTFSLIVYSYNNSKMAIHSLAKILQEYTPTSVVSAKATRHTYSSKMYDITGKEVSTKTTGVVISEGKKILK